MLFTFVLGRSLLCWVLLRCFLVGRRPIRCFFIFCIGTCGQVPRRALLKNTLRTSRWLNCEIKLGKIYCRICDFSDSWISIPPVKWTSRHWKRARTRWLTVTHLFTFLFYFLFLQLAYASVEHSYRHFIFQQNEIILVTLVWRIFFHMVTMKVVNNWKDGKNTMKITTFPSIVQSK